VSENYLLIEGDARGVAGLVIVLLISSIRRWCSSPSNCRLTRYLCAHAV